MRFTSPDELLNQRKPARFMRWSERTRHLNQFNGGFLIDGKVRQLSRRVSFQSLAQLEERYGSHGAKTILGGIGTETYFGGMDFALASDISHRLGTAFRLNLWDIQAGVQQGQLMRPDQVIRLKDNQMLVLHANRDPIKLNTLPFYARGDLRARAKMRPT